MLIILEGCDGAGKSTLVNQLAGNLPGVPRMLHFSQPEQHPLAEYEAGLDFYRPGTGKHVICDRLHWGEMIYSKLYRGESELGLAGFWHVEQYLRSRGALMVHVTAPLDVIRHRLEVRGEDYLKEHHVEQVREEFAMWARLSLDVPWTAESPVADETVEHILNLASHREAHAAKVVGNFPMYVGPLEPDVLLVAERPNENAKAVHHEAPLLPYSATAARYLIDNTLLPEWPVSGIGLTNALGHGDVPIDLVQLWHNLSKPRVVALGQVANTWLNAAGVPHATVPHPQWWRRFAYHSPDEYRHRILEATADGSVD